ncbi:hypothetical protein HK098_003431 [Nowakowskiella sp. JEL0407]|nr:hypothetical protein HK098_003431 [Nowakowskiella sp. JEL0407]
MKIIDITGSTEPKKCHIMAKCPEGTISQTFYGGIVLFVILDILILAIYFAMKFKDLRRQKASITRTLFGRFLFLKPKGTKSKSGSSAPVPIIISTPVPSDAEPGEDKGDHISIEDGFTTTDGTTSMDLLVDAFTKGFQNHKLSIGFKFQELGLQLKSGVKILNGVNGEIGAGKMTAIMGPSRAGKTTFMNVLMGKVSRSSGKLLEDVILRELSVRENIMHYAKVGLPRSWTVKQKEEYVDNIIEALGLSAVAHTRIGDEASRGISGGQRKRVNIALELAGIPVVIFLDEPTSGLDSTALQVANILRSLTSLGITIVSVIHQPRVEIFDLFTDVLMIAPGGETAYLGAVSEAKPYFEGLGYEFSPNGNPADIMMYILSGKGINKTRSYTSKDLVEEWKKHSDQKKTNAPVPTVELTKGDKFTTIAASLSKERGASTLAQTYFCLARSFAQQYAGISGLFLELFVGLFAGLLMGLAALNKNEVYRGVLAYPYTQLSSTPLMYTPGLFSLLIGLTSALASAPAGVKVFGEEKVVYWREAAAGHSRIAYYIGKTLATFPRIALSALHFTSMLFYLSQPVFPFIVMYGVIFMKFFGVYGLASVVSMVVARVNGPLLAVVFSLFAAVFCGYGPTLEQAKNWKMLFIWELSFNKWGAEILFSEYTKPYEHIYNNDVTLGIYGYTVDRNGLDFAIGFLIGLGLRAFAFVLLGTDKERAEKLFSALRMNQDKNTRVFWDNVELKLGTNFKDAFLEALRGSRVCLPIISMEFLTRLESSLVDGVEDNVLLEWDSMLEHCDKGSGQIIIPVFVQDGTTTLDFRKAAAAMKDVKAQGCNRSAKEIWEAFKASQGRHIDINDPHQVQVFAYDVQKRFVSLFEDDLVFETVNACFLIIG